jgi:hypothetical protein
MLSEKEMFEGPYVRAQLNTSSGKPDTYYATLEGRPVFVKGPHSNAFEANRYSQVCKLRRVLDPCVNVLECSVIDLKVDPDFLDTRLGTRVRWKKGGMADKVGLFTVFRDLMRSSPDDPIPTTMKMSTAWQDPVTVVDFSKVTSIRHLWYSPTWEESVYVKMPKVGIQVIKCLLLSWIVGTSADLAFRNFVIVGEECFQVDLEKIYDFKWQMPQTPICSSRTKAGEFARRFVTENWKKVFRPYVTSLLENTTTIGGDVLRENLMMILKRVVSIQSLPKLMAKMSEKPASAAPPAKKAKTGPE